MTKKKLLISFSGGRTSAYMTWWLLNEWKDRHEWEIVVVFANTGKEHEGTLRFVQQCATKWGIEIVWVESRHFDSDGRKITKQGRGVTPVVIDFKTASRNGEPFEEMIRAVGIPNKNFPVCSAQLKEFAIRAYLKKIGWRMYYTAIGIRADEIDRMNPKYKEKRFLYPLIKDNPVNKKMIINWWSGQTFDLDKKVVERLGNCDGCWKKSTKKLVQNAIHDPHTFDWWQEMTDKYSHHNPRGAKQITPPFNFYRGNISPKGIFKLATLSQQQLELFTANEKDSGCSESCEAF